MLQPPQCIMPAASVFRPEERVTHRFVNGRRFHAFGGKRFVQRAIHRRARAFQIRANIKRLAMACPSASCSS
jgi:hypothetical protein